MNSCELVGHNKKFIEGITDESIYWIILKKLFELWLKFKEYSKLN